MTKEPTKARRNLLLFLAHVGLALFFLAWFVYRVVQQ